MMKSKRAQIAATLTWVLAFLIIFFIMILFVTATILVSSIKKVRVDIYDAGSERAMENLEGQRALINLLNNEFQIEENKVSLEELIISSVNKYGDKVETAPTGGYEVGKGYFELENKIKELFEDSKIIWDIEIRDIETKDVYYLLKREDLTCASKKSVFNQVLENVENKTPKKVSILFEICKGRKKTSIEEASEGLTGSGP